MLKIKLSRTGRKAQAHYKIVVTENKTKRDTKYVANLGHYISFQTPAILRLNTQEYDNWVAKGAQATDTVKFLRSKAKNDEVVEIANTKKKINKKSQASE